MKIQTVSKERSMRESLEMKRAWAVELEVLSEADKNRKFYANYFICE